MEKQAAPSIEKAVQLFDRQEYRDAFLTFVDVYRQSADSKERQAVLQILDEAYYAPNETELRENYEENVKTLKKYPYFWEKQFHKFEDLSVKLFPISDELYYCYDRGNDCFQGLYDAKSADRMRYFFEHLDKPLRVEDEDNFYNLTFLNDNVRSSEDFAGDNHIYLMYSSLEPLERLMLACNLEPLLRQRKFVFLTGENRDLYPLDFKRHFGIDYSAMEPQKLRIEEMQRICFWYKRGYTGTLLGLDVLNRNDHIAMNYGGDLLYETRIQGCPLYQTVLPEHILKNVSKEYKTQDFECLYHSPDIQWGVSNLGGFIQWLKNAHIERFTFPELFRAYFIYTYYHDKPHVNPRIVPVILWEPHLNQTEIHDPLVLGFPYRILLNAFREPVQTVGRIYQREGSIYIPQVMMIEYSMNPELRESYYAYRFEDLKRYPAPTCKALCKLLNVPYEPGMLTADAEMEGVNGEASVRGFDLSPLSRNIDSAFSAFDQVRLQIFYDAILRHYGYPAFDFEECPMDDNDVAFLMKFPFKCEKEYVEKGRWEKVTKEEYRQRLFQTMMSVWYLAKQGKLVFPKVIFPQMEDGAGEEYGTDK